MVLSMDSIAVERDCIYVSYDRPEIQHVISLPVSRNDQTYLLLNKLHLHEGATILG